MLTDFQNLPVPCILHLRSEHFVVIREKRGAFYDVFDSAAFGPRWLLAAEVTGEATGAVLVSDAVPPQNNASLRPMDLNVANSYRGRCHEPMPWDHDDNPCQSCPCPPGSGGGGGGHGGSGSGGSGRGGACSACVGHGGGGGMPSWFVTEPFLNLWVQDTPLEYMPAYGPDVKLTLAYHDRGWVSVVSGWRWHGAEFGNGFAGGTWACSWLSFAELDSSENIVDLKLPAGTWATFTFPTNSNTSAINYRNNMWLEKIGTSSNITSLQLHYPDGPIATYAVSDTNTPLSSYPVYAGLFYLSSLSDAVGNQTTYSYDTDLYLTNVMAADGTTFTLNLDFSFSTAIVTNVVTSYGASVFFTCSALKLLSEITDAAGITSQITYEVAGGYTVRQLITPYGTTEFSTSGDGYDQGIFERTVRITLPNGTQEFYGSMNTYSGTDWPDFVSGQIPTDTPLNTLDTSQRNERNTFYWNAQQFAPYIATSLYDFTWEAFNRSRIRHWLAATEPTYTHFDTLSIQQEPSPDGSTNTQGQLTWYDYAGKTNNYERGSQVWPSVVARVMPDATTWYEYSERNSLGKATNVIEKWVTGGNPFYRTNKFLYATNAIDLLAHTNAAGVLASSNVFNAYHQVTTSYDALGQTTTYTYDGTTRNLTSISRPTGLVTTNIYDGNQRLQQTTDSPINAIRSYTWLDGNLKTLTCRVVFKAGILCS